MPPTFSARVVHYPNNVSSRLAWPLLWIGVLLSGCSGKFLVPADACAFVSCGDGTVCVSGECVEPSALCNPEGLSGRCNVGFSCIGGVCYLEQDRPESCPPAANGVCRDTLQACVSGTCTEIGASACGSDNPTGLCPGGEVCILGVCFAEEFAGQSVLCSSANPQGACEPGQVCRGGACTVFTEQTCSSVNFEGACPAWQTCAQGDCVGPVPEIPQACSPSQPSGLCPADEVCVAGTCTPLMTGTNTCSATRPNGLCPSHATCRDGLCIYDGDTPSCSAASPNGTCPAGSVLYQRQLRSGAV
ncbi:MAG: hypothetical protein R3C68_08065 [Myxococcota bacterium]